MSKLMCVCESRFESPTWFSFLWSLVQRLKSPQENHPRMSELQDPRPGASQKGWGAQHMGGHSDKSSWVLRTLELGEATQLKLLAHWEELLVG